MGPLLQSHISPFVPRGCHLKPHAVKPTDGPKTLCRQCACAEANFKTTQRRLSVTNLHGHVIVIVCRCLFGFGNFHVRSEELLDVSVCFPVRHLLSQVLLVDGRLHCSYACPAHVQVYMLRACYTAVPECRKRLCTC